MYRIFLIIFICLTIASCGNLAEDWIYKVTNESSKTVSYNFNNGSIETLAASESKEYHIKRGEKHTTIGSIDVPPPFGYGFSVLLKINGANFTFVDNKPYALHVTNSLIYDIKINAGSYIDNNGSTSLIIKANENDTSSKIYTNKPSFSSSLSGYPVKFDWNFSNNTVYLIIR